MKKLLICIFLVSSLSFSGCDKQEKKDLYQVILEKGKLVVGTSFDSKPFSFADQNGNIQGFEADLGREITKRILREENNIEFRNITSQDRIKAVKSGDVDIVISTMTITPQRKKEISFSKPYFTAGQVICVRKDSKINSPDDLINKKVIVILGTTGERNIKKFAPNALIQGYIKNSEAISAFKAGNDDAITTDDSLLQGLVMESEDYFILPYKLTKEPYGIAIKKASYTKRFTEKINRILDEIRADGSLQALKNKWSIN